MDSKTAYLAMYDFLDRVYKQTNDDGIGALLGGMSFLEDGQTADPAAWSDWLESVKRAQDGDVDSSFSLVKVD